MAVDAGCRSRYIYWRKSFVHNPKLNDIVLSEEERMKQMQKSNHSLLIKWAILIIVLGLNLVLTAPKVQADDQASTEIIAKEAVGNGDLHGQLITADIAEWTANFDFKKRKLWGNVDVKIMIPEEQALKTGSAVFQVDEEQYSLSEFKKAFPKTKAAVTSNEIHLVFAQDEISGKQVTLKYRTILAEEEKNPVNRVQVKYVVADDLLTQLDQKAKKTNAKNDDQQEAANSWMDAFMLRAMKEFLTYFNAKKPLAELDKKELATEKDKTKTDDWKIKVEDHKVDQSLDDKTKDEKIKLGDQTKNKQAALTTATADQPAATKQTKSKHFTYQPSSKYKRYESSNRHSSQKDESDDPIDDFAAKSERHSRSRRSLPQTGDAHNPVYFWLGLAFLLGVSALMIKLQRKK